MSDEPEVIPSENERMVYLVRSRTNRKKRYRVDLVSCEGATQCECRDWEVRRGPAIRAGEPHGMRATLCHHGIVARRHFLNGLLKALAKAEDRP